ncbi:MAG: hypothetical protein PHH28_09380, partial [Desulfuromonadaceae bacterium]|nr:hypothetical protein [Desulfuromonadaceae bacterium]
YNLTAANAGTSNGVSWTSFENLHDTAAGNFRFGATGSVTGSITATNGTLDYAAGITGPVAVDLTAQTGTGIGGTWNGITTVTGSADSSDSLSGSNQTFNLTGADAGNNGTVSWTSFENIAGSAGTNSYNGSGGSLSGTIIDAGSAAILHGTIQTGGAQTYFAPVTLGATTVLASSGSGNITFSGTLDSDSTTRDLTISTSGVTRFDSAVGATAALRSLTITAGGTTAMNGGSVATSGTAGQTYNNAVVLGADTTLNSGSGAINLVGTVNGAQVLNLSVGTGDIMMSGAVGGTTRLNALTITSANNVTASDISASRLNQVAGSGNTTLNGMVNTTSADGIKVTTGGAITDNGAITTTGNGPVILAAGSDVALNASVNSSGPITLTAGHAIREGDSGALITAGLLTTQSANGQTLVGSGANSVGSFNAANTANGDIILTNSSAPLTIAGINQTGGQLDITTSGAITSSAPLTVSGATTITAAGQSVTLADAGNDFSGTVTVTAATTDINDRNDLVVALNTTGPTTLTAGADMTLSGTSTDSISATAVDKVTLSNPTASILHITGATIDGTMNNSSPLDLTTTSRQAPITVNLTGSLPFLTYAGDIKTNIQSLGTYNGAVIMGTELDHYKATIDVKAATTALIVATERMGVLGMLARFDEYFNIAPMELIIDDTGAFSAPEAEPTLIDR